MKNAFGNTLFRWFRHSKEHLHVSQLLLELTPKVLMDMIMCTRGELCLILG